MGHKITIRETLEKEVCIEAESPEEAARIAEDEWKTGEHILDAESFNGVEFLTEREYKEQNDAILDIEEVKNHPGLGLCVICKYGPEDMKGSHCGKCENASYFVWRGASKRGR